MQNHWIDQEKSTFTIEVPSIPDFKWDLDYSIIPAESLPTINFVCLFQMELDQRLQQSKIALAIAQDEAAFYDICQNADLDAMREWSIDG